MDGRWCGTELPENVMSFTGMMLAGRPFISKNIIISSSQVDWNLITEGFGGVAPLSPAKVVITVLAGKYIIDMDLTGLPDGSTIRLINHGSIYGAGGNGGKGGNVFMETNQ